MHKIPPKNGHYLIKVPSDNMNIPSQGLEVVIGVLGAEVPCAQDVLDLARHQQLLELGREAVAAMGDVEISQHQHQLQGQEGREGDRHGLGHSQHCNVPCRAPA